jgi:REP element-mobilizing transposase RayT
MPRANRHYLPGYVWHITHRCHKKEFLLKFSQDRQRYLHWLFEAKKRYGLSVLNYAVTSNHVHLLVVDTEKDVISKSMQLVAGRTGQEYNQRKDRKGAFWEDRYHATIVQKSRHLLSCMAYIDLNMVRAGVVSHPSEWDENGYNEIIRQPRRYGIIDRMMLQGISIFPTWESLTDMYKGNMEDALVNGSKGRQALWSESIAVGDEDFVIGVKAALSSRATGRRVSAEQSIYELHEVLFPYNANFDGENATLRPKNGYLWNIYAE